MTNDIVKKAYNRIAQKYTAARDKFGSKKYLDKFIKLLPEKSSILDIGYGAGIPVDSYLVSKGFAVEGIDISEKQIALARKNVPRAFFEVKDMSTLQKYEYCVHGIVSFYAIFHTPREQHAGLFKKIASFMPKGGVLLVTMGTGNNLGAQEIFQGKKMFYSFYPPEKNREIIEKAGFSILLNEIDTQNNERHQIILAKI